MGNRDEKEIEEKHAETRQQTRARPNEVGKSVRCMWLGVARQLGNNAQYLVIKYDDLTKTGDRTMLPFVEFKTLILWYVNRVDIWIDLLIECRNIYLCYDVKPIKEQLPNPSLLRSYRDRHCNGVELRLLGPGV